ncbi:DUF5320 domain-containing protein [Methanosarcina barkeri]|uniref:DUF5320 domain-containing protein n=1 Tax=Methanosarcina barkeri CM1 TaxID=796385 RepID=A0A0G3CC00_METBA|nr:DUF5320 domain-containing protein [Methanosarcina barkeri]AKJ39541.1 hypothetical protein MCM1_2528 [Methanosarcina barkeri CM1]
MPNGDRKGPMGDGPKTGRAMGYCSDSDSPGYMTRVPADESRNIGRGAKRGAGRGAGRRAGVGFCCRKTPVFGRVGGFAARGRSPGYFYPEPVQVREESNIDALEDRIGSLKQELETLMNSLKRPRLRESDENK